MIPKVDCDAISLGQRSLCVLRVLHRIWTFACMMHLENWFRSWFPESVCSAGSGRSSVEAWCIAALDIEEVLSGAVDSHVHVFVADVIKSLDTVDRWILYLVLSSVHQGKYKATVNIILKGQPCGMPLSRAHDSLTPAASSKPLTNMRVFGSHACLHFHICNALQFIPCLS